MKEIKQYPRVTVLMPVYNGERSLYKAIESILQQTFHDFEFLIINDASVDSTREIILSYAEPRIRLIDNEKNIGLTKSLNKGLDLAKGEFVARMDADDLSMPTRLEKQVQFLEKNQDHALVGSWCYLGTMQRIGKREHRYIYYFLAFHNNIPHSSVMFRKRMIQEAGGYNEEFIHSQDYELWSRIVRRHKIAMIDEPLVLYSHSPEQISNQHNAQQKMFADQVSGKNLKYYSRRDSLPEEYISFFSEHKYCAPVSVETLREYFMFLEEVDNGLLRIDNVNRVTGNIKKAAVFHRKRLLKKILKNPDYPIRDILRLFYYTRAYKEFFPLYLSPLLRSLHHR